MTWQVHDGKWQVDGDTLSGSGGHVATTQEFTDGFIDMDVDTPAMGDRTVGIGLHITGSEGQMAMGLISPLPRPSTSSKERRTIGSLSIPR
jgi:hypothetical protein